jgi:hypothetical protein
MTPQGQESFTFEDEPLPSEPVVTVETTPSMPHLPEGDDVCQYCGLSFEGEGSCRYCANNYKKKDYLKRLTAAGKESAPLTKGQIVQNIMERMRNDPRNAGIKNNDNALRARAEIIASAKPGTSYETTPYPPLDN